MDYEAITALRDRHPAWRLLRAGNAALALSFLGEFFVEEPDWRRSIKVVKYRFMKFVYNQDMALSIKHPEADRLARELAARTGETLTEAVVMALRERLARTVGRTQVVPLREELAAIRRRCAALPVLDDRTAESILGYDDRGLPS